MFCPANAIEEAFYKRPFQEDFLLVTREGKMARATFCHTWNNAGGRYDKLFDELCLADYGMPFKSLCAIWFSRLGRLDDYWHLIKLEEV